MGLSGKQIRAAAFEQDGTIWLGAAEGLYCYDGYDSTEFGVKNGLPSGFVAGLLVDRSGTLWVSTSMGVASFDQDAGRFIPIDKLAGRSFGAINEDDDGTLWFCETSSGLVSLRDGRLQSYDESSGLPSSTVTRCFKDSSGRRFALTSKGLAQQRGEAWFQPLLEADLGETELMFRTAAQSKDGGVLFATDRALFVLKNNQWTKVLTDRTHQIFPTQDGEVLSVAPARHWADFDFAFHRWDGGTFVRRSPAFRLSKSWSYWQGASPDRSVWMASYNRLIRWGNDTDEWQIYDADLRPQMEDSQGRIWFSGQANAMVLDGDDWYQLDKVSWPFLDRHGKVWFHSPAGAPDGMTVVSGNSVSRLPVEATGLSRSKFAAIDGVGNILNVGRDEDDAAAVSRNGQDGWHVTRFGTANQTIHQSSGDRAGGIWVLLTDRESPTRPEIAGLRNGTLTHAPELPTLPAVTSQANDLKLLCDHADRLWMKCGDQVLRWEIGKGDGWVNVTNQLGTNLCGWSPQGGRTWFAVGSESGGKSGLAMFEDGRWSHYAGNEPSWFDRWDLPSSVIGFDSQFFSVDQEPPRSISLPFEGTAYNGLTDSRETTWLSVRDRLMSYRSDGVPPKTKVIHDDYSLGEGETLQFDLIASLRFQSSENANVRYQRKVDDQNWSEVSTLSTLNRVAADALGVGSHRILFRAVDQAGDVESEPVSFNVMVIAAIWKQPWFVFLMTSLVGVVVLQTARVIHGGRRIRRAESELKKQEVLKEVNRLLEQKVEERTAALSHRNEELRAFAHSVSHDLRAPLRAMEGFAIALSEDYGVKLDDTAAGYIENIVDSATRMDELVNDLLEYSKLGLAELTLTTVSLSSALNDALRRLVADVASCGADIQVVGELHEILGHHATVVQIIQNLVSNSLKFVRPDCRPVIRLKSEEIGPGTIRFSCIDNGIGIESEYHERIFSVFERLHGIESYEGTGIGLAIVSRACHRLGGRCGLESATGAGSCFWIELPAEKST